MSSKLIFEFDTIEQLMKHVSHMADLEIMDRIVQQPEPPNEDQRGKHIKRLHELSKLYQLEHPEMKYHECMRIITKLNKNPIVEAP